MVVGSGSATPVAAPIGGEVFPRLAGCALFGFFLGATLAATEDLACDRHGREELLLVIGTDAGDVVDRRLCSGACDVFLQAGLVVLEARTACGAFDAVREAVHDDPGCGFPAAIDVHGADDGLEGVGEDRTLLATAGGLFALAERQGVAEIELASHRGERDRADHVGAELGHASLRAARGSRRRCGR